METLPNETILQVMLTVPIPDLLRNRAVNKQFDTIAKDDYFWRLRLEHDYPTAPIPPTIGEAGTPGEPDKMTYRDLYFYWYHRPTGESRLLEIPVDVFDPREFGFDPQGILTVENENEMPRLMNSTLKFHQFLETHKIRRGDVVHLEAVPAYRNDGKYIYDGREVVPLDFSLDEYGAVPAAFQVINEFPIRYWQNTIEHNCIIHFDLKPYLTEILKHLRCRDIDEFGSVVCQSHFTHWSGVEYTLIIPLEEPISDKELQRRLEMGIMSWCDELGLTDDQPDITIDPETTLFLSAFAARPGSENSELHEEDEDDE
jgi:hypothetical protein